MLRNYFKVAMRHLLRNKGITFINIAGLATGVACCILIVLFIRYELSYNNFHESSSDIYRLTYGMKREISKIKESMRVYDAREVIVAAGAGALVIAFANISFQAVKAALLNPVRSLRSE